MRNIFAFVAGHFGKWSVGLTVLMPAPVSRKHVLVRMYTILMAKLGRSLYVGFEIYDIV